MAWIEVKVKIEKIEKKQSLGNFTWLQVCGRPSAVLSVEGIGSTSSLKQASSSLLKVAYSNGGSFIGTMSPKPIVDSEINAKYSGQIGSGTGEVRVKINQGQQFSKEKLAGRLQ